RLVINNAVGGDNKAKTDTFWPKNADAYVSYGGDGDTWGLQLTPDDVNDDDFGVAISVERDFSTSGDGAFQETDARIDHIRMTVFYTVLPENIESEESDTNNAENVNVPDGDASWTNLSGVQQSDDSYAVAGLECDLIGNCSVNDLLWVTGFNFDVPEHATITGVLVEIERSTNHVERIRDLVVNLVIDDEFVGINKADTSTYWPTT